jgi:hypothetical protein
MIWLLLAIAAWIAGLSAALAFFWGSLDQQTYRNLLLAASVSWFVFATMWARRKEKP